VLGDDVQKRMLFAGHQRCQRAYLTPHLLTLAGSLATSRCPRGGKADCRVEPVEDGLGQLPQFRADVCV